MIEKVNPMHPDKIADRIAGAIVDLGYKLQENPKIAVEVLIGHGNCKIIIESSVEFNETDIFDIVYRITQTNDIRVEIILAKQDEYLAKNQKGKVRCGDNGIFKGTPLTEEQNTLSNIARNLYNSFHSDGKYILDEKANKLIICQSNVGNEHLQDVFKNDTHKVIINPLGDWTGGTNVDTGATNRKLGSDMGDSITGGRTTRKRFVKSRCKHKYICVYESTRNRENSRIKLCNWR